MEPDNNGKKHPTPYIPWKTFKTFIDNLHGKVPDQIDASVLRSMSGTARSQLLSALKFLDLIGPDGTVRDRLKHLVDASKTPEWKNELGKFIVEVYGPVIGNVNISAATPAMLRERFRSAGGVDGATIDLAQRFYLNALKEAGIPFSSHLYIRQRAPRGFGVRKRPNGRVASPKQGEIPDEEFQAPEGTFELPLAILGLNGSVFLPDDISQQQWDAVSQYVKMVIGLRQQAQGGPAV